MCEELDEELENGITGATLCAQHLHQMGAAKASIPVEVEGIKYVVTIECVGSGEPLQLFQD